MNIGRSILLIAMLLLAAMPASAGAPVNFYNESNPLLDVGDQIGDDKGPGYYQYPLDKRIRRGTYDLKHFTVYEEDGVVTFVIQTREYIMTEWPDTHKSDEQGFVTNVFDIYIDLDGRPNTGYHNTLPGRELEFADNKGWEKVILVTPLSQFTAYDILREKTDDLSFQNMIPDVILPDYVLIQRDKIILKISKELLGNPSPNAGYQCLSMGYSHVVSPNRMLNMDVRAFPTPTDFGGGWDTYGDPPVMDLLMPEDQDQYETLRAYRSQPFRDEIVRAKVPFIYANQKTGSAIPPVIPVIPVTSVTPVVTNNPVVSVAPEAPPKPVLPPSPRLLAQNPPMPARRPSFPAARGDTEIGFLPLPKTSLPSGSSGGSVSGGRPSAGPASPGFVPLKKIIVPKTSSKTSTKDSFDADGGGFIPLKKKTGGAP